MKKRQLEKEHEQKRMYERLEAEKAARERIQLKLKQRREIRREKEEEDAKLRVACRDMQNAEVCGHISTLVPLITTPC
jgi:DNA polymerase II small subunit/DNA polymerase delta subunit B